MALSDCLNNDTFTKMLGDSSRIGDVKDVCMAVVDLISEFETWAVDNQVLSQIGNLVIVLFIIFVVNVLGSWRMRCKQNRSFMILSRHGNL